MKVNDVIPEFDVDKFMQQQMAKLAKYPGLSKRESVGVIEITDPKEAEEVVKALDAHMSKAFTSFEFKSKSKKK